MGDRTYYHLSIKGVTAPDLPFLRELNEQIEFEGYGDYPSPSPLTEITDGRWDTFVEERNCGDLDSLARQILTTMKAADKVRPFRLSECAKYEFPGWDAFYIPALERPRPENWTPWFDDTEEAAKFGVWDGSFFMAHSTDDGIYVSTATIHDITNAAVVVDGVGELIAKLHEATGKAWTTAWDEA